MGNSKSAWAHFDNRSEQWTNLYKRAVFRDRLRLFVDSALELVPSEAHILDYGCGTGVISLELANHKYSVDGVDAAEGMITQAKINKEDMKLDNVIFTKIDPNNFDLGEESYDAIVCSSVVEYVDDDIGLLKKFASALKPNGHLIITLPHDASLLAKLEDFIKSWPGLRGKRDVAYCQRRYNKSEFEETLRKFKFDKFSSTYFEVPKLGHLGITLSRLPFLGLMLMIRAKKCE